ncbi:MAG TPA: pseudaminic acid cytidylyltransferase [Flavipsychrobacter sp.]|nr:pseudaminic acid cytidylyltransferase [Flavipsychrobacter sp.]
MNNLCIIPARGGSKRIPGKNIRDFLGKPVIAYSIEAALGCSLFSEVMVSTDDDKIAGIATALGAHVPFRRTEKTADDFATTVDVIIEVLDIYRQRGISFDNVCCLYPCAPFINAEKITLAFQQLEEKKLDAVFPVVPFSFPVQRALVHRNEKLSFLQPENALRRSQDLETTYHDAGQFYWLNTAAFLQQKKIVTANSGAIILSELDAQDIDNETDWKIAELKYQLLR